MTGTLERIEFLLLVAALVAMLARRLRIPYTVGLVLAGAGLALVPLVADFHLTTELIFSVLLPPLVFEAAFHLPWRELRRDLPVVIVLATVGVALSVAVTAVGMRWLAGWAWQSALLFGVLIAATDPVSVIATFKDLGVRGRLRILVEAESLFNDGTAAVAFALALTVAAGGALTPLGAATTLLRMAGGGILCGALIGWAALQIIGRTDDHLIELTFTTIAAYGSFQLAEHLHLSGVLATLTAGLLMGNTGHLGLLTNRGHEAVASFWEYMAFVANSLIFLLIGRELAQQNFGAVVGPALIAIVVVLVGRLVAIYPCSALFARTGLRVSPRHQHVLVWGGLRGALALALALGLPQTIADRGAIITVAFAVVAASVFVQGLTMQGLLRRLGELPPASQPASPSSADG